MTTFRLARSPTASIVGAVRGTSGFVYTIPTPGGSLPAWMQVPTQVDEQLMYDNVLNWAWTAPDKATDFSNPPPATVPPTSFVLHDDSEADDLWNFYQCYKRTVDSNPTAANIYLQWATKWRDYFVNRYYNDVVNEGFTYDHLYGWGLCMWGVERSDAAALAAAEQLAIKVEELVGTPGNYTNNNQIGDSQAWNGPRRQARKLLFMCYYAQINPIPRWIQLRDHLINLWVAPQITWEDTTNSPIVDGGMHFFARGHAPSPITAADWDAGLRVCYSWQTGIIVTAHWLAYKATGRTDVRDKLVDMAKFCRYYAWNPSHVNAMVGTFFGHFNGGYYHLRSSVDAALPDGGEDHADPTTAPTSSYDTSLVNLFTYAYKITGDVTFLDKAKAFLRQGTQYAAATGAGRPIQLPTTDVHHYLDTKHNQGSPGSYVFYYNKGEGQYAFAIAENGGNPAVETAWPPYRVPTLPGEVVRIAGDATSTYGYGSGGSEYPTNVYADVRCPEGSGNGNSSWWGGDTRNKFIASFSQGGAVVIVNSGGHSCSNMVYGASLFDFADARWKRVWTTQGNPGVDNVTNEGPPPSEGGPPYVDVRAGTLVHGCPASTNDNILWYSDASGSCFNPAHWPVSGTSIIPRATDPRDQHWEVSLSEQSQYVRHAVDDPTHGWPYPEGSGQWNGMGERTMPGRYERTGYVMESSRLHPIPKGTLEPTQSEMPAPGHVWDHFYELTPALGGGPRGSIITGITQNQGSTGVLVSNWSHRFDLHTGIWHKFSVNNTWPPGGSPTAPPGGGPTYQADALASAQDSSPGPDRVFMVAKVIGAGGGRVNYMNLTDREWRNFSVGTGGVSPGGGARTEWLFVDPDRRLLIVNALSEPWFWAVDLQTLGTTNTPEPTPSHALGGWKVIPITDGPGVQTVPPWVPSSVPTAQGNHGWPHGNPVWRYYPPNGKFYRINVKSMVDDQAPPYPDIPVLQRLTPPPIIATPRPDFYYTTEAMSGRWTIDEIPLVDRFGAPAPVPAPTEGMPYAAAGFNWFHYVPALQCMAYAPLDFDGVTARRCVFIIKPG